MKNSVKEYIKLLHGKDIALELLVLENIYNSTEGLDRSTLVYYLGIERRTLYKAIEHLNTLSSRVLHRQVLILSSKNNYIFEGNKEDFYKLRVEILDASLAVSLAKQLLIKAEVNLFTFCLDNYVGENTVRRRIKAANHFLTHFNIQLSIKKQHIFWTGDEIALRHGLISFFWMTYEGMKWPFDTISKKELKQRLAPLFSLAPPLNKVKQEQLLYILAITLSRVHLKKAVYEWGIPLHFEALLIENPFFLTFKSLVEEQFAFSPQEIKFLFFFLLTLPEFYVQDNPLVLLERLKLSDYPLHENIFHYFDFIQEKHPEWQLKDVRNKNFLSVLLSGVMNIDLFQGRSMSLDNFALQKHWNHEFPHLLPTIEHFVKKTTSFSIPPSKQHLLSLIYARTYIMLFPPHDFEPPIQLLLQTAMPLYVEEYMQYTLSNILLAKFNIHFLTQTEHHIQPDLILSTHPIEDKPKVTTLLINPEISDKDILSVFQACEALKEKNSAHLL